jgi:glycolate oxidase FAD binding subunit
VGGVVATADSGPLRHHYGTVRDLVLGVTLALSDGTLARAGGKVIKNVAGYDLGKLMTGSHGSLAAIVLATFKLVPRPMTSGTIVVRCADHASAANVVRVVAASQWEPLAFDVSADSMTKGVELLLRFASTPAAVGAQLGDIQRALAHSATRLVEGDAESALWQAQVTRVWTPSGAVVRCGWLPAAAESVLDLLASIEQTEGVPVSLAGRVVVGSGQVRLGGEVDRQVRAIARLRAAAPLVQHVVVLRASPAVKAQVDVWGGSADADIAMQAVKRAFDPAGVLNAGRGPV